MRCDRFVRILNVWRGQRRTTSQASDRQSSASSMNQSVGAREDGLRLPPPQRVGEGRLGPDDDAGVAAAPALIAVHVAMLAAGRNLDAAVPGVPRRGGPFDGTPFHVRKPTRSR